MQVMFAAYFKLDAAGAIVIVHYSVCKTCICEILKADYCFCNKSYKTTVLQQAKFVEGQ